MSFLYRTQPALRSLARPSSRLFTATAIQNKSATEAVKETVKGVDRVVSDAAVTGIEKGQQAAAKAREVAGVKTKQAKTKTGEVASEASSKAQQAKAKTGEMASEASSKAQQMKDQAGRKAQEMKHETKGKMYEAEGKAKATAEDVKAKGQM